MDNEEICIYLLTISITTWSKFFENWITCIFVVIIVVIIGIATCSRFLRSKYDCRHLKNYMHEKLWEINNNILSSLSCDADVAYGVYVKRRRMMMGEKGRTRRKKANVYIQKVHASCYFLSLLTAITFTLINDHPFLFLNCLLTIGIFYQSKRII